MKSQRIWRGILREPRGISRYKQDFEANIRKTPDEQMNFKVVIFECFKCEF